MNVSAELVLLLLLATGLLIGGLGVSLWQKFSPQARLERAYHRARQALARGDWQAAQVDLEFLRVADIDAPEWIGRLNNLEGEWLRLIALSKLEQGDYSGAVAQFEEAEAMLGLSLSKARDNMARVMHSHLRRRMAERQTEDALQLAQQLLKLRPHDAEAAFWSGILAARTGQYGLAATAWQIATQVAPTPSVETILYYALACQRTGRAQDAQEFLTKAHRLAPTSPIVAWHWGMKSIETGSSAPEAIRSLQIALSADGLPLLLRDQAKFWQTAFPGDSLIGLFAQQAQFDCPFWGSNIDLIIRQTWMRLGTLLVQVGRNEEAVKALIPLLNRGESTAEIHANLGIALARLRKYDQASEHFKIVEQQSPRPSYLIKAFHALSVACADSKSESDRLAKIRWAVEHLGGEPLPRDVKAVQVAASVYKKALSQGVPVSTDDLLRFLDHLMIMGLAEPLVIVAVDWLMARDPDLVSHRHACFYAWATAVTQSRGRQDLAILARVFSDRTAARLQFSERQWDWDRVETIYLERWLDEHTGFPPGFDADEQHRIETTWLARAADLQQVGKTAEAEAIINRLARLCPGSTKPLEHQARLAWNRGDFGRAVQLGQDWMRLRPDDPIVLLRYALMLHGTGQFATARDLLRHAFDKADDGVKATVALAAARCALQADQDEEALHWLAECLRLDPENRLGFSLAVAFCFRRGDQKTLSPWTVIPPSDDPLAQLASSCACWAAGDAETARSRLSHLLESSWSTEALHFLALMEYRLGHRDRAAEHLAVVAKQAHGPTAYHAQALLGQIEAERGQVALAVERWLAIPNAWQSRWGLKSLLPLWLFRAGVEALRQGNYATACRYFRQAEAQGYSHHALADYMERAAVGEVQQCLTQSEMLNDPTLVSLLERASGRTDAVGQHAVLLLARLARRENRIDDYRRWLDRLPASLHLVEAERACQAIREHQLEHAEFVLENILHREPNCLSVRWNLFWVRLSAGKSRDAWRLWDKQAWSGLPSSEQRLLKSLWAVTRHGPGSEQVLAGLNNEDESRLIQAILSIGRLPSAAAALKVLCHDRPTSQGALQAWRAVTIWQTWRHFQRHEWLLAERCLQELLQEQVWPALHNLLGIVRALQLDFDGACQQFGEALRLAGDDPRIHQNLALTWSWAENWQEAELHWGRYLGLFSQSLPHPPAHPDYHRRLRLRVICERARIADERGQRAIAEAYWEEAARLQPEDPELLERLFRLKIERNDFESARQILARLRTLCPGETRYDLDEMDCIEIENIDDLERLFNKLLALVSTNPNNQGLHQQAVARFLPKFLVIHRRLAARGRQVVADLDRLPSSSQGWYTAQRELRQIVGDLQWLNRVVKRVRGWVADESLGNELRKIEVKIRQETAHFSDWLN